MREREPETSHLAHVTRDLEKDFEFTIGMIFASELEAYHKYVAYAIGKGFGVRKSKTRKNDKGEITRWIFVCNCAGPEVRYGCPAFIKFKIENGVHKVMDYVLEHNHEFIPKHQKHLIRCRRMISNTCKGVLVDMAKVGIGGTMAYKFLANEAEGSENLGFILRDCQNFLQSERSNLIEGGDCQKLLNHFHCMQMQNPMFFYA
ncbi:hypothetical protein ACJRO7_010408 [Eucalyptus globulus]|uniref:Protein FAR1-RELATED SEQUENCE n=1 Tax=Eucalyptus globulus TaxID=34317 RepID=A0ABD3LLW3_EUCGL